MNAPLAQAVPTTAFTPVQANERAYWIKLIGLIFAIKSLLLAWDHAPMFFLGDSVSYLNTATGDWIPPDRSFMYGWLVWFFAVKTGSLTLLLVAQMVASACCAVICAGIVRGYFKGSRVVAGWVGVGCAVEPLQLLYERYMMTEAFSLLVFALFSAIAIGAIRRPSVGRMVVLQVAGVALVSLRVSYLPLITMATVLVPVLGWGREGADEGIWARILGGNTRPLYRKWVRMGGNLVVSYAFFTGFHTGYKAFYAHLIRHELPSAGPAYYYENGFHLLSFVASIVEPGDFPDQVKAGEVFGDLAYELHDPKNRVIHRWWDGGLIAHVKAAYPDPVEANRMAERTAWNAVKRNPMGEIALSWRGFADYFDVEGLKKGLITDRGSDRELPADLLEPLKAHFGIEGEGLPHLETVTNRYFFSAWGWYWVLLLWPVPGLAAVGLARRGERGGVLLIWVFGVLVIVVIAACSILPTVRFLHPVAWLAILTMGVMGRRLESKRSGGVVKE